MNARNDTVISIVPIGTRKKLEVGAKQILIGKKEIG
jgi:hypothetical protein